MTTQSQEVVLSGIRATGRLHFGNMLGAVRNFVRFQEEGLLGLYFVADYHTLTTRPNPRDLRGNHLEIVKDYIAAGLNPESSILYVQSSVPALAELSLLLGMLQPLGDLQRVPTFKDLARKNPDNINLGTITYPVLMAADILGPKATLVPVGEDQVPNLEMARRLARSFNETYGETFPIPEMMKEMVKVPGLGGGKMGKSESDDAVEIGMPIPEIRSLYRTKGVTDPSKVRKGDPGDPYHGCASVYPVHEIITDPERVKQIASACRSGELGCADCKNELVDNIAKILEPFQERRAELAERDDFIREILADGAVRARARIEPTVEEVYDKMGLIRYG